MEENCFGEQKFDFDWMLGVGQRRLEDCVEEENSVVVAPQAEIFGVPEEDFVLLCQVSAVEDFPVGIYKARERERERERQSIHRSFSSSSFFAKCIAGVEKVVELSRQTTKHSSR
jgi:hypothetical protein